ncbi:Asp-tRNA(Asn)/Glu-tRNA(Gln) amidotransferase subunit GatC [Lentisphaera profundi]|uniref:Aspartyl/glutamyl-tRNA(Asn/Gln) amidotransferase subunit C n=1 Tax=Lentisphaera profundi TaxID=1658616 RepID=A0ABY7VX48_9BACT|nr:Asp-tRNA(Asn)/Glu-tRNA(Gln) amidotransferase subunit GatC [Lentisphaera profundi]WDE97376.1 Asp-tRNA(Asn)/Glu-tRNA(Gln) amidotransferase subunit GatC [Lentisphaera profundi]
MSDFDVEHFAKLSRLNVSPEEVPVLQKQMNDILVMVNELMELDLEGIEGTNFAVQMENVIREDKSAASLPVEVAAATFPDREENLNRTPVILEDND